MMDDSQWAAEQRREWERLAQQQEAALREDRWAVGQRQALTEAMRAGDKAAHDQHVQAIRDGYQVPSGDLYQADVSDGAAADRARQTNSAVPRLTAAGVALALRWLGKRLSKS
jgi:hypothetical protein